MRFMGSFVSIWSIFMQLFLLTSASTTRVAGNEVDRLALLAFKDEVVDGSLGILSSWNESLNLCQWPGIACGHRHQRVTALKLGSSLLMGTLSPHIGNLRFLRTLQLQNNSIKGTIPQEIGHLFRLQILQLDNNSFTGEIPTNISRCSNLQYIGLAGNALSGKLPNEIGSLSKLQVLSLGKNMLSGEIPPSFGNLSSLLRLSLDQNVLHGGIPKVLGNLKNLELLSLSQNRFNGTIPPSIFKNLSSIKYISVASNNLHGALPPGLGHTTFPNLETFLFQMNMFSGPIPITISNASHLSLFSISKNMFTRKVPSLARMSNLLRVDVSNNSLGNEDGDLDFLSSLVNCTNLESLYISDNVFQGPLPESISNLSTKLTVMSLGGNRIQGNIPIGIGNLINLGLLGFEKNLLTGHIPRSISNLFKLYSLSLNYNNLAGRIPSSLGNLTMLGRLNLGSNNLQGSIPPSLGNCKQMIALVLSNNLLNGSIPHEVISLSSLSVVLDLSSNHLTDSIPFGVGQMLKLSSLDLSDNILSGEIPKTIGNCMSLESLHLEGNLLNGTIREYWSSLRGLKDFDLSRNYLSGGIPNYFGSFPFLENLNLSFNDLEGEVPVNGVFKNSSALSIKGNTRLCGGTFELQLPPCNSKESEPKQEIFPWRKFKLSISCGGVIGVIIALYFLLLSPSRKALRFVLLYRSRKARLKSISGTMWGVSVLRVSYGDLLKATNGFSSRNLIGSGSFGCVYRGILHEEERIVAVKVLNDKKTVESFIAECEALKNIRHRNLVKLLTMCSSIDYQGNEFKALVYEFMANGNLEEWLHTSAHREAGAPIVQGNLNLIQRVNIAIDIANAVNYLHNHSHTPIVHCDLKPSNILLEGDMTARVGDFGLARYLPDASCSLPSHARTSNFINGSIGYISPEYGMGNAVSTYGDVYSYGILLLEMLTCKRPTNEMFKDDLNLHNFVLMALPERVEEICDPVLLQRRERSCTRSVATDYRNQIQMEDDQRQKVRNCLVMIARIGVACSAYLPRDRMDISNALDGLCLVRDVLTGTNLRLRAHLK